MDFLTFEYKTLTVDECRQLAPQVVGPVLGFDGSCAVSRQAGAILLDLGGKPSLDPARGEPPGHYNLIWNGQTVAAAGHYIMEKLDAGYIREVSLSIKVPQVLAEKIGEIKQLFQAGMTALYQGTMPEITEVKVILDDVSYV
jgi:hypothetical protein